MIVFIEPSSPPIFPPATQANEDGLLAFGGDLSVKRLLAAYRNGIFPWYNEGGPIMWFATNPRSVLFPHKLHISRSMKKVLKKNVFTITSNHAFESVIKACRNSIRKDQDGTWITREMVNAYIRLHRREAAVSFEAWDQEGRLCGGLYGVLLGGVFFGESMFSRVSNASKAAFMTAVPYLSHHGVKIIDTQMETPHLNSMGAELIPLERFLDIIRPLTHQETHPQLLQKVIID